MKLFVFEYACAGGDGSQAFLKEGRVMLESLLADLARLDGLTVSTLLSPGLELSGLQADFVSFTEGDIFRAAARAMESASAVWLIAPECGGTLTRLVETAEQSGKQVIGPGSRAVKLCGDKLALSDLLGAEIPLPETRRYDGTLPFMPAVVKPVDGAGSENVFLANGQPVAVNPAERFIVQKFIEGETLSAGVVSGSAGFDILGVCSQVMELRGNRLRLKRLEGPVEYGSMEKLNSIVELILERLPSLRGYWGIDFIDNDGAISIIEINPRLTTSWPLYSEVAGENLARKVMDAVSGGR
jgi:predicted ATP-grasp superfamily ATP-dependent carboligase